LTANILAIYYLGQHLAINILIIIYYSLGLWDRAFSFLLVTNHIQMKTQQTTIAEVQLIYKSNVKASDRPQVKCSRDAYKIFMENWNPDIIEFVEEFKILLMNRPNAVLGILEISKGGISGTVTDVRVIFQAAIKGNASGIIWAHNHPSGNLNPSESDTRLTQKIKEAGNLMDIQLLDHLILTTDDNFYSFADNGLL
jgi:DNA repair protein RadC